MPAPQAELAGDRESKSKKFKCYNQLSLFKTLSAFPPGFPPEFMPGGVRE